MYIITYEKRFFFLNENDFMKINNNSLHTRKTQPSVGFIDLSEPNGGEDGVQDWFTRESNYAKPYVIIYLYVIYTHSLVHVHMDTL